MTCLLQIVAQGVTADSTAVSSMAGIYAGQIEAAYTLSKSLFTTCLTIMGGSILLIVSDSYIKPKLKKGKLFYLLFMPAWIAFLTSLYYGNNTERWQQSASVNATSETYMGEILRQISSCYNIQFNTFLAGCIILGIWLMCYLCWWIFKEE
jgi:hypothetical protein